MKGPDAAETTRAIASWWTARGCELDVNYQVRSPHLRIRLRFARGECWVATVRLDGKVSTVLYSLAKCPPFDAVEARREVLEALARTFGQRYEERTVNGEPTVPLAVVQAPPEQEKLFAIWQSMLERVRTLSA